MSSQLGHLPAAAILPWGLMQDRGSVPGAGLLKAGPAVPERWGNTGDTWERWKERGQTTALWREMGNGLRMGMGAGMELPVWEGAAEVGTMKVSLEALCCGGEQWSGSP